MQCHRTVIRGRTPLTRRPTLTRLAIAGLVISTFLWATPSAQAQPQLGSLLPNPRLFTVMPCGAKGGGTVELTFTGTDLDDPKGFLFSHPGIKAVPVIPEAPKPDPKKDPKGPPVPVP